MRIACWIPKATNTPSEYVILINFPLPTMVIRTRLNVTLYVQRLSCYSCILFFPHNQTGTPFAKFLHIIICSPSVSVFLINTRSFIPPKMFTTQYIAFCLSISDFFLPIYRIGLSILIEKFPFLPSAFR